MARTKGRSLLALVTIACFTQCDNSVGVPEIFEGDFALAFYDGMRLPANLGELPSPPTDPNNGDSGNGDCSQLLNAGELILDGSSQTFRLEYSTIHSCTGELLSEVIGLGTYQQQGSSLVLLLEGDEMLMMSGQLETLGNARRVLVQDGEHEFDFRDMNGDASGS
ncbi:MAG TPA: hypothetical protein VFH11_04805 [Gemmatimonadota bacterium]|nr:hypothetical protein [Gemmatimonadota bacterium]